MACILLERLCYFSETVGESLVAVREKLAAGSAARVPDTVMAELASTLSRFQVFVYLLSQ